MTLSKVICSLVISGLASLAPAAAFAGCKTTLFKGNAYKCVMNDNGRAVPVCIDSGYHLTVKTNGFYIFEAADQSHIDMFLQEGWDESASVSSSQLKGSRHKRPDVWDARRSKSSALIDLKTGKGTLQSKTWGPRGDLIAERNLSFINCKPSK